VVEVAALELLIVEVAEVVEQVDIGPVSLAIRLVVVLLQKPQ
jgi:hypothetical protein